MIWKIFHEIQCESGLIESPLSEINFLISLAWVEGGIDVGDPMLKIEKCFEGDRGPPTPQGVKSEFYHYSADGDYKFYRRRFVRSIIIM